MYDSLLGRDFIVGNHLNVTFSDENVIVTTENKVSDIDTDVNDINNILLIDRHNDETEVNLNINDNIEERVKVKFLESFRENYLLALRPEVPKTDFEMKITVKPDQKPFFFRPRRLSFYEKNEVDKIIDELLNKNIIKRSVSEYSTAIVLVAKKTQGPKDVR